MAFHLDGAIWWFCIVVLTLGLVWLRRKHHSLSYLFFFAAFGVYCLLVVKVTLFPIVINPDEAQILQAVGVTMLTRMNWIPFYYREYSGSESLLHALLNIFMTVPFGFGISFIARLKARNFIGLAFGVGLGIEAAQLIISILLGYPYRVIDINDVLCNAAGVGMGYGVFRAFAWGTLSVFRRFKIKPKGLLAYIQETARRAQPSAVDHPGPL